MKSTNIYTPLKEIYDSNKIYSRINLQKYIILLTDGKIKNKEMTLSLIEKNNNRFKIISIGFGNSFDEDLIKSAGIKGKGNYNFCKNIEDLNRVIIKELYKITVPYINSFYINCSLDEKNLINNDKKEFNTDELINLGYIINKKDKTENVKLEFNFIKSKKDFQIKSYEIDQGEELFKLLVHNYLINNSLEKDKLKLSLKYQILTDQTTLFAEIKLNQQMKEKMIDAEKDEIKNNNNENNNNNILNINYNNIEAELYKFFDDEQEFEEMEQQATKEADEKFSEFIQSFINNSELKMMKKISFNPIKNELTGCPPPKSYDKNKIFNNNNLTSEISANMPSSSYLNKIKEKKQMNLNEKNEVMNIISAQDFINGNWNINPKTNKIKIKYEKQYNLLKNSKNYKFNDSIIITILVIFFINKEYPELYEELLLIIRKGKLYIKKNCNDIYENIIKQCGIIE